MAFSIPTFNLSVTVYRSIPVGGPLPAPSAVYMGNLQFAQHTKVDTALGGGQSLPYLLLPKGTDIRAPWDAGTADFVEVPTGSSRFYGVVFVDDVGKGFANEYRVAALVQDIQPLSSIGVAFPVPLP